MATVEELLRESLHHIYQDSVDTLNTLISLTDQRDILNIKNQVEYIKNNIFLKDGYNITRYKDDTFKSLDYTVGEAEAYDFVNHKLYSVHPYVGNSNSYHLDIVDLSTKSFKRVTNDLYPPSTFANIPITKPINTHLTDNGICSVSRTYTGSRYDIDILKATENGRLISRSVVRSKYVLDSYYDRLSDKLFILFQTTNSNNANVINLMTFNFSTNTNISRTIDEGYSNAQIERGNFKFVSEDTVMVTRLGELGLYHIPTGTLTRYTYELSDETLITCNNGIGDFAMNNKVIYSKSTRLLYLIVTERDPVSPSDTNTFDIDLKVMKFILINDRIGYIGSEIIHVFPCSIYKSWRIPRDSFINLCPIEEGWSGLKFHLGVRVPLYNKGAQGRLLTDTVDYTVHIK